MYTWVYYTERGSDEIKRCTIWGNCEGRPHDIVKRQIELTLHNEVDSILHMNVVRIGKMKED